MNTLRFKLASLTIGYIEGTKTVMGKSWYDNINKEAYLRISWRKNGIRKNYNFAKRQQLLINLRTHVDDE